MRYSMFAIRADGTRVLIRRADSPQELTGLPMHVPEGEYVAVEIVESKNGNTVWVYWI